MKTRRFPYRREPSESEIQHRAFLLWEEAGRPEGRDLEFWFTAREWLAHRAHLPRRATGARTPPMDAEPPDTV